MSYAGYISVSATSLTTTNLLQLVLLVLLLLLRLRLRFIRMAIPARTAAAAVGGGFPRCDRGQRNKQQRVALGHLLV